MESFLKRLFKFRHFKQRMMKFRHPLKSSDEPFHCRKTKISSQDSEMRSPEKIKLVKRRFVTNHPISQTEVIKKRVKLCVDLVDFPKFHNRLTPKTKGEFYASKKMLFDNYANHDACF